VSGLCKNILDRAAVVDIQAFAAGDVPTPVVEAEQMQRGGVQVGVAVAVAEGVVPTGAARAERFLHRSEPR